MLKLIGKRVFVMFDQYYNILGLKPGASENQIRKAFKKKAKKFHPDLNDSPDAQQMFVKIQEAYDVLLKKKPIFTSSYQQPDPAAVRRKEEKRKFQERVREIKKNARERAYKDYLRFRRSVYFTLARFSYLFLLFTGIIFLIAPIIVFFLIKDRAIMISLFSVPIGIHIINVTYQHYRSLYPPQERSRFFLERILDRYIKVHDPVLLRGFIGVSVIATMMVFCLLTRAGANTALAALLAPFPVIFSFAVHAGSKSLISKKKEQ
ncbi:J domain-containing protein [Cytophagaceae bacterium ABcell3]|nr:J domain-containing protein [Cytophagaceae bacterium ABcell3]